MKKINKEKWKHVEKLLNDQGIIGALAIDQRGALKRMMKSYKEPSDRDMIDFKTIVSEKLTPYASSILLDPEYGIPAADNKDANCGLLLAYEKTGYDSNDLGKMPDLLDEWSVKRLKEAGADACKFLIYYDADQIEINRLKKIIIERIGSECIAENIPFFLEILTFDQEISDNKSKEFAKVKPQKVIDAMKEFSDDRYNIDVLKVEIPVNMNYVEGYGQESVYTQQEAAQLFIEQSKCTNLPFIFLSAGVSPEMFQETLLFAKSAGSEFNGVLCGRATWAEGVRVYANEGEHQAKQWMGEKGKKNLLSLNEVISQTASPVSQRLQSLE
ncbi:tagatose-bisphosphate aldolase [Facklamia sp. DSM 111018]|uniref:Tagatose 1,6-diphosphate aldolase n=1 Tax=Facklamia lactis TaxID=2749967 RepID=A0ABS0LSD1_9LACT|nr:tagatose-bisphosphate aldolase [Facklamia lactis]MBG9986867.1 tagatose-bisphosphate aldolase [Facklamia lactis]